MPLVSFHSPYQQDAVKDSKADALHRKLEQIKQLHVVDSSNTTTCSDGTTIEDIIKTSDNISGSITYSQCKTLQN